MPLDKSSSDKAVSKNIKEMQATGKPHDQAVAAALRNQDEAKLKEKAHKAKGNS
jgi:hypothetical protein